MSLALPAEDFRALAIEAVEIVSRQIQQLEHSPTRQPVPADLREAILNQPLPRCPTDPAELLAKTEEQVMRYPMGNISPRFFAWVNSPAAPLGIIGDLLAAALNPSVAGGDHSATYVEHVVLNWLKEMMGVTSSAGAILTSGGSLANFTCLAAMRHRFTNGTDRADGLFGQAPMTLYSSDQAHFCVERAAVMLGFGSKHLRKISTNDSFQIDTDALRDQVNLDRKAGLLPACVIASAGTVNTGAIDPLEELADFCLEENLWLHVDGAYGGVGVLLDELSEQYQGIERADSIAIDPHKWLYAPIECGCAIVSDAELMRDTFSFVPEYVRDDSALPWLMEFGPQQTRGFKALKLWLMFQQIGIEGYRSLIRRDIKLAETLRGKILAHPDFELVAAGPLSITCFRYAPQGASDLSSLNEALVETIQQEGECFLATTKIREETVLRACIVNFRTTEADLDKLLDTIESTGKKAR